jgi:CheY-like chemotaxis protein
VLHRSVAAFIEKGLQRNDRVVAIARRATFDGATRRLASRYGVCPSEVASRIAFVEVEAALDQLMNGTALDATRSEQVFRELVTAHRNPGGEEAVWVYGEMADLLCRAGRHAAASDLEGLGTMLAAQHAVSVLCSYALGSFGDDRDRKLKTTCLQHTHVVPAERDTLTDAPTVYIVDDHANVRKALERLLVSSELRVETFPSCEAFLAEPIDAAHACMVVDIQLGGMSGLDLQRRMAAGRCRLPIIAMTALNDADIEQEAMRLGATRFLRKPFDGQVLIDEVARVLGGATSTRAAEGGAGVS